MFCFCFFMWFYAIWVFSDLIKLSFQFCSIETIISNWRGDVFDRSKNHSRVGHSFACLMSCVVLRLVSCVVSCLMWHTVLKNNNNFLIFSGAAFCLLRSFIAHPTTLLPSPPPPPPHHPHFPSPPHHLIPLPHPIHILRSTTFPA